MGTVRLKADEQFLEAAVINDVGNPIIVKQDTIEFNASSYRVGSNAMLRDLLKRMPGMEITDDGKVRFNGETVDKIRVIDRDSEETRATGVQDGTKEKYWTWRSWIDARINFGAIFWATHPGFRLRRHPCPPAAGFAKLTKKCMLKQAWHALFANLCGE